MGKTINTGFITESINGVAVNVSYPAYKSNYDMYASRYVNYIVVHYTGNNFDTPMANAKYFSGAYRGASAHLFVKNNDIYQSVALKDVAYSVGRNYGTNNMFGTVTNDNSINIEMCCDGNYSVNDATKETTCQIIAYLLKQLGMTAADVDGHIFTHYEVCSKSCPKQMASVNNPEWVSMKQRVKGLMGANVVKPEAQTVNKAPDVKYQTYGYKWYQDVVNDSDYAGVDDVPISAVYANTVGPVSTAGTLKTRVHIKNGSWLPWVTDRSDYAGIVGRPIDAVQFDLQNLTGYTVQYRVSVLNTSGWLPWVTGTSDYAGIFGKVIDKLQVKVVRQ